MPSFIVHDFCSDIIIFLMKQVEDTVRKFDLSDITADNVKSDTIPVVEAHPIAVIGSTFTAEKGIQYPLPVIGVILMNEDENDKMPDM